MAVRRKFTTSTGSSGFVEAVGAVVLAEKRRLKILGLEARKTGDARKHARPDLFSVVEGEDHVRPAWARQRSMRAALPPCAPADALECGQNATGPACGPSIHAAENI
jgi:hypothetical protein